MFLQPGMVQFIAFLFVLGGSWMHHFKLAPAATNIYFLTAAVISPITLAFQIVNLSPLERFKQHYNYKPAFFEKFWFWIALSVVWLGLTIFLAFFDSLPIYVIALSLALTLFAASMTYQLRILYPDNV